jgi:hypothetical protein
MTRAAGTELSHFFDSTRSRPDHTVRASASRRNLSTERTQPAELKYVDYTTYRRFTAAFPHLGLASTQPTCTRCDCRWSD